MKRFWRWRFAVLFGLAALALAATGWFTRETWLSWYYVRGLRMASEQDRQLWIDRVDGLDAAVVPQLLDCLEHDDAQSSENIRLVLAGFGDKWGLEDARSVDLAAQLARRFPQLSFSGQQAALKLVTSWLLADRLPAHHETYEAALRSIQAGVGSAGKDVRTVAYEALAVLVRKDDDRRSAASTAMPRAGAAWSERG
jgi:hypothetical protein